MYRGAYGGRGSAKTRSFAKMATVHGYHHRRPPSAFPLNGLGCSFFSRSRSAQSPSILFNIRSSNASAEAVGMPGSLQLPNLTALLPKAELATFPDHVCCSPAPQQRTAISAKHWSPHPMPWANQRAHHSASGWAAASEARHQPASAKTSCRRGRPCSQPFLGTHRRAGGILRTYPPE
jgi:hypothetical protein